MALAHNVGKATRRAYFRAELLDPRKTLMYEWGGGFYIHNQS